MVRVTLYFGILSLVVGAIATTSVVQAIQNSPPAGEGSAEQAATVVVHSSLIVPTGIVVSAVLLTAGALSIVASRLIERMRRRTDDTEHAAA
ncbi:MAG: hypothetical protein AAF517_27240 [Planctomycetota bacterium]